MTIRDHEVRLADGRILRTQDSGAADGQPVLFHEGLGSRLVADPLAALATHAGLRLLSHDRPGFGGSTAQPGRRVADAAADVTAIADQLGVDRFAVWGTSGGGPFALACTALLPDRVVAAALVSPLARGAEGAIEDELAVVAPWGIEPTGVRVPVRLWSGAQDTDTPPAHARWLVTAIPGASLRQFPDEGHLSLIHGRYREVVDWLAEHLHSSR